jgi:hypothetical protein
MLRDLPSFNIYRPLFGGNYGEISMAMREVSKE